MSPSFHFKHLNICTQVYLWPDVWVRMPQRYNTTIRMRLFVGLRLDSPKYLGYTFALYSNKTLALWLQSVAGKLECRKRQIIHFHPHVVTLHQMQIKVGKSEVESFSYGRPLPHFFRVPQICSRDQFLFCSKLNSSSSQAKWGRLRMFQTSVWPRSDKDGLWQRQCTAVQIMNIP